MKISTGVPRAMAAISAAAISLFVSIGCDMPGSAEFGHAERPAGGDETVLSAARSTVPAGPKAWDVNTHYKRAGIHVSHKGRVWVSQWWITRGQEPGANTWNGWKEIRAADPPALTWAHAAAGWRHSLAINSRGELYAWGRNRDGQLGDGTAANRSRPVKIAHP